MEDGENKTEKALKGKYFQFCPELNIPIFIHIREDFLPESLITALNDCSFVENNDLDGEKVKEFEKKNSKGKILFVEKMALSLGLRPSKTASEAASRSQESVQSQQDHFLYRYYGHAAMIYSPRFFEWRLGLIKKDSAPEILRLIFHRFLALALAPFDMVGVWGELVQEGILIMNMSDSKSKAVYLNPEEGKIVGAGGKAILVDEFFKFVRLDSLVKDERRMSKEELYAFIMARITYLHTEGIGQKLRNVILSLSKISLGIVVPKKVEKIPSHNLESSAE